MVEVDIPPLITSYDATYNTRKVNINEDLVFNVSCQPNQDPDLIDYSAAIVYDYDIEGILRFNYF